MILFPQDLQTWLDEKRRFNVFDIRPEMQRVETTLIGLEATVISEEQVNTLQTDGVPAVLICQFGLNTERVIRENGMQNVYSLLGGVQAWNAFKSRNRDLSRYTRQMVLPEVGTEGQRKLLASGVAIVGMGGLGCSAVQYLAAAGVGFIKLIDGDIVETSNIHRQPLYHDEDVGRPKAAIVAQRLRTINPDVSFEVIQEYLNQENRHHLLKDVDVILDATDSLSTRHVMDSFSRSNNVPLVYGGLYRYEGQVAVFNRKGSSGYRDLFPEETSGGETCIEGGMLGMLPGIIGNIQALETVKVILDIQPNLSGKLLLYNGLDHTTTIINLN